MNNFDDYDFTPSASSNLASLFESSSTSSDSSILTYTAPKQPKLTEHSETKSEPKAAESSVICARVVQVWKLVDSKYIPMGKHGLAIIGSSVQNAYEVILYREKRNIIVRVKISQNLEISSKKDGFASFYDSLKENWLIKFSSSDDCTTVLTQIESLGGKTVIEDDKNETCQTTKYSDVTDTSENPENRAKADILSRIAKMGQSILPNKNTDIDDSGSEDNFRTVEHVSPRESQSFERQPIVPAPSAATTVQVPPRHFENIPSTVVIGQPMGYDPLNLYFAESRAQNTEIRMNLSHLSDKVNQILKLVDNEKPINDASDTLKSKIKVLDLRNENLLKELRMQEEENARLKLQISQHSDMLHNLEESRTEIKLMKEQEIVRNTEFKTEINTYRDSIEKLHATVEKQKIEIEELKSQLENSEDSADLKNEISNLKEKLKNFEETQNASKGSEQENKEKMANFVAELKNSMNEMYGNILGNLAEGRNYETSEISSIIAHNIKSTTVKIIHNFQQVYKNETQTN